MVLLFAGESYYAKGGMNDFQGCFTDVHSAMNSVDINLEGPSSKHWDWWQVICQETLDVISQSECQAHGCGENSYCPSED